MSTVRHAVWATLASASFFLSSSASAGAACSQDTLAVDEVAIHTSLCSDVANVTAGVASLPVHATLTTARGRLAQDFQLRYPALAPNPRAVADIDLSLLGIPKTLHMTLRPAQGAPTIERALLLPGPKVIR